MIAALALSTGASFSANYSTVIVRAEHGIKSLADLDGTTICVQNGNDADHLEARFEAIEVNYNPLLIFKNQEAISALADGSCDAYYTENQHTLEAAIKNPKLSGRDEFSIIGASPI